MSTENSIIHSSRLNGHQLRQHFQKFPSNALYARELVETVEDDMQMPYRLLAQPRIARCGLRDL
jgi:hypothetical protein